MNVVLPDGRTLTMREAIPTDAQVILDYMEIIIRETKNLAREPEEWNMTVEQEEKFLKQSYDGKDSYMLVVFNSDKVIAVGSFGGNSLKRLGHRVRLGISILEEYRNVGLGTKMMEILISKAREYGKRTIELDVRADNGRAIHVYEKLGFVHEGRKKEAFYVDGEYIDLALMAKYL